MCKIIAIANQKGGVAKTTSAMQEIPELKGLSETCNRIYKLQDVDVLFQCLLMDQMDWEEEKLYVQFSTIYLLKQTVKN